MPNDTKRKKNSPDPKKAAILLMYALEYARSPEGEAAIAKAKEGKALKEPTATKSTKKGR